MADDESIIFGDATVPLAPKAPRDVRLIEHAEHFVRVNGEAEEAKQKLSYLKDCLVADLPDEPGEYSIDLPNGTQVVVTIPEQWAWDKKLLAEIYPPTALPDCMSASYTINKERYEASSDDVKMVLRDALTIKCGPARVKVNA